MEKLFVYGTLLEPEVQMGVFQRVFTGTPARLKGYERISVMLDGAPYPSIKESRNGVVVGEVFAVTPYDLMRADKYEGVEYKRIRLTIKNGADAWVYKT